MFVQNKKKVRHLLSSVSKFSINKIELHPSLLMKTQFLSELASLHWGSVDDIIFDSQYLTTKKTEQSLHLR